MRGRVVLALLLASAPALAQPAPSTPTPAQAPTPAPAPTPETAPTPPADPEPQPPVPEPPTPPADLPPPGSAHDPSAVAGYDHGLYIATPDDAFRLALSGWLQARWELDHADGATDQRFSLPVGRLLVSGHAFATTDFMISADGAGGSERLLDAYLDQPLIAGARLRVGQFKPWFSQQQITDRVYLEFTARPVTAAFAGIGRDLGATIYHEPAIATGGIEWALGVFDGSGVTPTAACTTDGDPATTTCAPGTNVPVDGEPLGVVRVGYQTARADPYHEGDLDGGAPRFAIGVGYAVDLSGGHTDHMVHDITADAVIKGNGASISGAVFVRNSPGAAGRDTDAGFHAQLGYMIVPRLLELAARYAQVPVGDHTLLEATGVLDVYRRGHAWKWQLEGGAEHVSGASDTGAIARIQTQLLF